MPSAAAATEAGVQTRCAGVHDEGADAAAATLRVGLGEHAIEIGQSAVADPGFLALQHKIGLFLPDLQRRTLLDSYGLHSGHIRAGVGFAQRKRRNLVAARHGRQIGRLLRRRAGQRDRPAA
jgi:hypothetical protein